jgi:hypothetical protein
MDDYDVEKLLARYRPAAPRAELDAAITQLPDFQITRFPRTWPWAVAAAALLSITLGLHPAARSAPYVTLDDQRAVAQRVESIANELGDGPGGRLVAGWIVQQERRADREAQAAQGAAESGLERR